MGGFCGLARCFLGMAAFSFLVINAVNPIHESRSAVCVAPLPFKLTNALHALTASLSLSSTITYQHWQRARRTD